MLYEKVLLYYTDWVHVEHSTADCISNHLWMKEQADLPFIKISRIQVTFKLLGWEFSCTHLTVADCLALTERKEKHIFGKL